MNLYCKIFVEAECGAAQLAVFLSQMIHGSIEMRTVSSSLLEMDVVANDGLDEAKRAEGADGFLCYPYYLDVEPATGTPREVYVQSVGSLLERLWNSGFKAVAACEFESELPKMGGLAT